MRFQKSSDTLIIEGVLRDARVEQLIRYDELSKAIGRDVRKHALSALGTARRVLLRDDGIVFGTEAGVGLRRLDDANIVTSTVSDRKRLRRASMRSLRKLEVVAFDKLGDSQKRAHITASAQLGAIAMMASRNAAKKIESRVNGSKDRLAIGDTLSLFT